MTDTELKEYQSLANKAAILVSERMSKGDNSAEYIDSLFGDETNE